ncbi:hypothetical protein [Bradyrhizobium sp. LHD-71]|uniref:hypothetical protein n=1 Tax=Bradyrhizobium sp. LHD-71 TaxID=3072141 RepID=UPI00280C6797|nr:hypothetical protein [Bradyrhizobium sp. LHD-71]MDQ8729629.1 hypothetical protein [Bradyrhizobium sp. LHD-71]
MQTPRLAIFAGAAGALLATCLFGSLPAEAGDASVRVGAAQPIEASAQSRRRAPTRLRIERERYLPPTAVRACDAWYEQEFRPSGTVIVPRMRCRWVAG